MKTCPVCGRPNIVYKTREYYLNRDIQRTSGTLPETAKQLCFCCKVNLVGSSEWRDGSGNRRTNWDDVVVEWIAHQVDLAAGRISRGETARYCFCLSKKDPNTGIHRSVCGKKAGVVIDGIPMCQDHARMYKKDKNSVKICSEYVEESRVERAARWVLNGGTLTD